MLKKLKLQKKNRYFIFSLLSTLFVYLASENIFFHSAGSLVFFVIVITILGVLVSHYPNLSTKGVFFALILPLSLTFGFLLSNHYFPNVSKIFKLLASAGFFGLYYLLLLIDNIFLVVKDKEDTIPLYRVALTWSQIVQVVVAIPLFAGIFKLNINGLTQALFATGIAFIFTLYQIWAQHFDIESKKVRVGEIFLLCLIVSFMVFTLSVSVTFIPTEAFLRGLLASTGLMFGLSYIGGYLKNNINKKMIFQYSTFVLFFLLLLIVFQP